MDGSHNEELLRLHISAVVPLMIYDIMQADGITERHIEELSRYSDILASEGDTLLYQSKKRGKTARVFNALCRSLAIGAFFPGGIKFMGMHFEALRTTMET